MGQGRTIPIFLSTVPGWGHNEEQGVPALGESQFSRDKNQLQYNSLHREKSLHSAEAAPEKKRTMLFGDGNSLITYRKGSQE